MTQRDFLKALGRVGYEPTISNDNCTLSYEFGGVRFFLQSQDWQSCTLVIWNEGEDPRVVLRCGPEEIRMQLS